MPKKVSIRLWENLAVRIGIDTRCLEEDKISGIGEYTLALLENILEIDKKNEYLLFSNSFKDGNNRLAQLEKYPNVTKKRFRLPNKFLNLFVWFFGWPKIDKLIGGADIFFAPNINFIAVSADCPYIVTFHDLSFERFSKLFNCKTRIWHFLINPRKLAHRAKKIISVSESTGRDLEKFYGVSRKNISVISSGLRGEYRVLDRNDQELIAVKERYNLPHKFILILGTIEPRKNVLSLIKAYENMRDNFPALLEFKLALVGKISSLAKDIRQYIEKSKYKKDIFQTGYVNNKDKVYLYNLASLFVYPSFFEGFGFPPLEAMAAGTPVITSNNSSLPEVAGKAAILIDPSRPQEIARAMQAVLSDEQLYDYLREKGLERARVFTWKRCAEETLAVIQAASAS
jgi:glycosyltransferase involved in cell wall biosynthesis